MLDLEVADDVVVVQHGNGRHFSNHQFIFRGVGQRNDFHSVL